VSIVNMESNFLEERKETLNIASKEFVPAVKPVKAAREYTFDYSIPFYYDYASTRKNTDESENVLDKEHQELLDVDFAGAFSFFE
jgi:hypothetical protein